jgi:hypothetical protein
MLSRIPKTLYRNYTSDDVGMKRDIYISVCKCFDELQTDSNGVDFKDTMSFIMKDSKGRWNPMIVQEILKEFEK